MVILGIDPGLATVGYGVIESEKGKVRAIDCGVIITPKDAPLPERLLMIESSVIKIIERFDPQEIAMEELFFNSNQKTAITVAEARGVTLLT